jgi:hypothetical protein
MNDQNLNQPIDTTPDQPPSAPPVEPSAPVNAAPDAPPSLPEDPVMQERLERLGGEPAPAITPEEFARLQKAGQVHIDARGRVRTAQRSNSDAGVSLRKRRAWYGTL